MKELTVFGLNIQPEIFIPVLYFLWVSILLVLKKIIFLRVHKFAKKTAVRIDDVIIKALDKPLVLFIFVSGAFLLDNIFQFGADSELLTFINIAFKATAIVAIIMFFDGLLRGLINVYAQRVKVLKESGGVLNVVVRMVVMGLGLLILLDNFGVSITPILASLGIGSLAIALALQPTLENFFSGIQLVIDKPISIGNFIKLESGEEGYVQKIGWRSTWIRILPDNIVVIPNNVLVNSRVLNYYYPQKELAVYVNVGVHYDSDLEHVEKVTLILSLL
jgi:small-conductance mechanosensitive channel